MKFKKMYVKSPHGQKGSVLLWGLIILLTLTVIGVTAARMGVTDTRIAGNQMFGMMTYQAAESALERVTTMFHIQQTSSVGGNIQSWDFQDEVNRNPEGDGDRRVNSTATVSMGGPLMCTGQEGFAMSIEMNPGAGSVACRLFTVNARANLPGSGARSQHAQGILKYLPATGDSLPSN